MCQKWGATRTIALQSRLRSNRKAKKAEELVAFLYRDTDQHSCAFEVIMSRFFRSLGPEWPVTRPAITRPGKGLR